MKAENASLKADNDNLKAEKEDLTKCQKTDEESSILDTVAKAGGKEWLDTICKMKSTFNASNRTFQARGDNGNKGMSRTQQLLAKAKQDNEAKRAARK